MIISKSLSDNKLESMGVLPLELEVLSSLISKRFDDKSILNKAVHRGYLEITGVDENGELEYVPTEIMEKVVASFSSADDWLSDAGDLNIDYVNYKFSHHALGLESWSTTGMSQFLFYGFMLDEGSVSIIYRSTHDTTRFLSILI